MDVIYIYATKWCKREKASNKSVLDDWKQSIKDIVTKKIARFSKRTFVQTSTILEDDNVINYKNNLSWYLLTKLVTTLLLCAKNIIFKP